MRRLFVLVGSALNQYQMIYVLQINISYEYFHIHLKKRMMETSEL